MKNRGGKAPARQVAVPSGAVVRVDVGAAGWGLSKWPTPRVGVFGKTCPGGRYRRRPACRLWLDGRLSGVLGAGLLTVLPRGGCLEAGAGPIRPLEGVSACW